MFMRTTTVRKIKVMETRQLKGLPDEPRVCDSKTIEEVHEDHHYQEDKSDEDQVAQRFTVFVRISVTVSNLHSFISVKKIFD